MQLHTRLIAAVLVWLPLTSAQAEEPTLQDLLRDGLYAEEVHRDAETAAKHYEQLLSRYTQQRDFAVSALFRLAEVRRKQDRKDDAIQLYQRLLTEFPGAATETKLARENLAALGGNLPESKAQAADPESEELARLEALAKTAPDIIQSPETLDQAVGNGWSRVVTYLMAAGSKPYVGDALSSAAGEGYLEIVKQLMATDAPIPADKANDAIWAAIESDRSIVLEYLLQKGLKPGKRDHIPLLTQALLNGKTQAAEALVKFGADLNETGGKFNDLVVGTALAFMIQEGKFDAADWLLAKGAKPDVSDPQRGSSPLHYAALGNSDRSFAMMQKLLEGGADPNRKALNLTTSFVGQHFTMDGGALIAAIHSNYKMEQKVRLLLQYKADPNASCSYQRQEQTLLRVLAEKRRGGEAITCLALLIEAGAKPDEALSINGYRNCSEEAKNLFFEKFTVPNLVKESEIQLAIHSDTGTTTAKIAGCTGEESPPDLGSWLLANHQNHEWAQGTVDYDWWIWRKNAEGVITKQELDFSNAAAAHPLRWGDVVECRIDYSSGPHGYSPGSEMSPEMLATLRKRIAFPITFEMEGKTHELTVRGDRTFFDPTKAEVPLVDLQSLVSFFWNAPSHWNPAPILHVTRKNWPDVRLSYGSKEAEKFQVETGDRIRLEISDLVKQTLPEIRKETVTLKTNGYPYSRSFGLEDNDVPVLESIPTLIQMLTDAQCPVLGTSWTANDNITEIYFDFRQFSLFPHPDLASIRIRRLQEGGTEKVIEVNLAKIIAASNDKTTPEEARKADVTLQMGDIVEVSLIKEHLDKPWKGFTQQEDAFFAKALSGRVRVTDQDGNLSVRDLIYTTPRYIEKDRHWLPVPPESGMASLRGSWMETNASMKINRGELQATKNWSSHNVFLREGDEISMKFVEPFKQGRRVVRSEEPDSIREFKARNYPPPPVPSSRPKPRVSPPPQPVPAGR